MSTDYLIDRLKAVMRVALETEKYGTLDTVHLSPEQIGERSRRILQERKPSALADNAGALGNPALEDALQRIYY